MISPEEISLYLQEKGYNCTKIIFGGHDAITVTQDVGEYELKLVNLALPEISGLPKFFLLNANDLGQLAHVENTQIHGVDVRSICVNDRDSISVNFNEPLLAIEESLKRHLSLLEKVITDPEWNQKELLREFQSFWLRLCEVNDSPILFNCESGDLEEIDVYRPIPGKNTGFGRYYLAQAADSKLSDLAHLKWEGKIERSIAGKAVILPLDKLEPAPNSKKDLTQWYLDTISCTDHELINRVRENTGRWKTNDYWLILNAEVPSGRVWFCLYFKTKKDKKRSLPLTEDQISHWKVTATHITLFNKETVLPRGGANLEISQSKVALFGAGSVGSEISHKLSAAGIQNLDIFDNDFYHIENLYRHILPEYFLHWYKANALSVHLKSQFPWSQAHAFADRLLQFRHKKKIEQYDLIIIAIGSPTHERLFKEFLLSQNITTPVINTWLEGFGVGGHATLDIPQSKGCLLCAYVCPETLNRGLSSNLNFIDQNQNVTKNLSGCGEQFISYGSICSAQTALIASNLAIRYLEGKLTSSSKVSWKGYEEDAISNGVSLTNRFYQFNDSLQIKPLLQEDCDVCS